MDEEFVKNELKTLNYLEEQTLMLLNKNKDISSYENSIDLITDTLGIDNSHLGKIVGDLENESILKVENFANIPEGSKKVAGFVYDENGNPIDSDDFIYSCSSVNIEKLRKYKKGIKNLLKTLQDNKLIKKVGIQNKYSNTKEDINLKTLGIIIKGDFIIRGKIKENLNPTDKKLIYHLYYKSLENKDECFSISDLSKDKKLDVSEKYLKNRITTINRQIKKIINKELRLRIPKFIKKEGGRGYHLNPKILHK